MTESEVLYNLAKLREGKHEALRPIKERQRKLLDEYADIKMQLKILADKQTKLIAKCKELEEEKRQVHNEILNTAKAYEIERDKYKQKLQ